MGPGYGVLYNPFDINRELNTSSIMEDDYVALYVLKALQRYQGSTIESNRVIFTMLSRHKQALSL